MKVLTVIPLARHAFVDELTYFSVRDTPPGSVVDITLRGKSVPGLVVESTNARDMKTLLRNNSFSLKKVGAAPPRSLLTTAFITAARSTAHYHATLLGPTLATLLPASLVNGTQAYTLPENTSPTARLKRTAHEAYALQAPKNERYDTYKNIVRESFARKESVLLIVPNARTAKEIKHILSIGIDKYVYALPSTSSKKTYVKLWTALTHEMHSVVVITTPSNLSVPRNDVGTLILEQAASTGYIRLSAPYIDTRIFIEEYARATSARLIYGDTVLPAELHKELDNGTLQELAPISALVHSKASVEIVDTRITTEELKKQPFATLSPILQKSIQESYKQNKKIFILAPRRGLAPLTVCRDCKNTVTCDTCSAPVMLHKKKDGEREFLCRKCGAHKSADTTCAHCNSWRLDTLGVGIELVESELREHFPDIPLTRVDKETCSTDARVSAALTHHDASGGILLGTQLALTHLIETDLSAVASLDALLSIPDFSVDETVFRLLLTLKEKTREQLFIQTRMPERSVLTAAQDGSIVEFMRHELDLRQQLKYPPYTVMIRLTKHGSKRAIVESYKKIMPKLEAYNPRIFHQFERLRGNTFALHCLLRIPCTQWPHDELILLLKTVQPEFIVRINPHE